MGLQKYLFCSASGWGESQDGGPLLQAQLALSLRFQSGDLYGGLRKSAFTPPHSAQHLGRWGGGLGVALQGSDAHEPEDVKI